MYDHRPAHNHDDLLGLYSFTDDIFKYAELLCDNGTLSKDSLVILRLGKIRPSLIKESTC